MIRFGVRICKTLSYNGTLTVNHLHDRNFYATRPGNSKIDRVACSLFIVECGNPKKKRKSDKKNRSSFHEVASPTCSFQIEKDRKIKKILSEIISNMLCATRAFGRKALECSGITTDLCSQRNFSTILKNVSAHFLFQKRMNIVRRTSKRFPTNHNKASRKNQQRLTLLQQRQPQKYHQKPSTWGVSQFYVNNFISVIFPQFLVLFQSASPTVPIYRHGLQHRNK